MGEKKMSIFLNLPSIVKNKEVISSEFEKNSWRSMEYKTSLGEGQLLITTIDGNPQPIVLDMKLSGWQKLYVGIFHLESYIQLNNYSYIKLSDDDDYTPIKFMSKGMPKHWKTTEYFQEIFWKCADVTGQKIVVAKPEVVSPSFSGIAWIRCEEMSPEEISRYQKSLNKTNKCVQMHIDVDCFADDISLEKQENFAKLSMLKNTAADFCSLEYSMLFEEYAKAPDERMFLDVTQRDYNSGKYTIEEVFEKFLLWSEKNGVPLYATERMSVATFHFPLNRATNRIAFAINNKQFHCKNRDLTDVAVCSYAYHEVQDYVLNRMIKMVKMGFKGISMILHRGIHVGFEEPVIKHFKELYPDVDPFRLPISDERLHSVWCEIMTGFMRRLRKTLDGISDERIALNAITDYGLESAKNTGLDIEQWAKEGLIDSVSQADMEIYEDLTDCMSNRDASLIDLENYKKRLNTHPVLCRNYGTDVDKVCAHIPEYKALEEKYGVKVFHVLPWVHTIVPEEYMQAVEQMKKCGAERFLAWNTNHMIPNRPEFTLVSSLGNDIGTDAKLRSFYRVLSLDNVDISQAVPNWRG